MNFDFSKNRKLNINKVDLFFLVILVSFSVWFTMIDVTQIVLILIGWLFIWLSFQDFKTKEVGLNWVILLMILSFIQLWLWFTQNTVMYEQAVISALFAATSTGMVVLLSRGTLLGTGDVFILTSAAIVSPGIQTIFVYLLFSILGIIYYGVKRFSNDKEFLVDKRIPLVPFVALAVVIIQIVNNYLDLLIIL